METKTLLKSVHAMSDSQLLEAYEEKLKSHDWTYAYSDNHTTWSRGHNSARRLRQIEDELDERGLSDEKDELYNKYGR